MDQVRLSQALADAVAGGAADAPLAVCRACVAWLPVTGASITMMAGPDRQEPVCATDDVAARIDELQFSLGDGPCVESFTTGRAVLVADITDPGEHRWPVFSAAVAETGARGMFVFPLHVGASRIGVLDCYRDTSGPLDDQDLTGALRAADAAVWTLLDTVTPQAVPEEASGVQFDGSALTRAQVHQATGMLIAQAHLTAAGALARLRAAAFATGRPISEVADDIVARRLRLHPDGSWRRTEHGKYEETTDDPAHLESRGEENPS